MKRRGGRLRVAVVIPAGGRGTRMGGRLPKQFLTIDGEPILTATVRQFAGHPSVDFVVVAGTYLMLAYPGLFKAIARRHKSFSSRALA